MYVWGTVSQACLELLWPSNLLQKGLSLPDLKHYKQLIIFSWDEHSSLLCVSVGGRLSIRNWEITILLLLQKATESSGIFQGWC